jgi:tRNA-specific 2-thiouridylase
MKGNLVRKQKVFVGLSGGVDSSVAALRLLAQGYDVVGVFIKVWQPTFLRCNWEEERLDAMRVAAHLGIPFLTCDAEEEYKKHVGEYFVSEYLAGRTPNPDVMCNRHVKFGAFWNFAKARGADFIATGHYAQVRITPNGHQLLRGVDQEKDQSYFLWPLTQEDLNHTLFPVGNSSKNEIRQEAAAAGLPTAKKKDSQGVCFLGHVDIPEFMGHFTTLIPGKVVDTTGKEIGEHQGALVYTLGQRHGFLIFGQETSQPHYVVAKDLQANILVVNTKPPVLTRSSTIVLDQNNWISGQSPGQVEVEAAFRYRQTPRMVKIAGQKLTMAEDTDQPAAGQSVVFYDGEICLGGGVIQ